MAAEKQFESKVKRWLHSIGIYAAGTPSDKLEAVQVGWYMKVWGGGYQKSGIPDMLLCVNGFFIAVELKASNGIPSDLQKMNTARINQTNGIGMILYPEGFDGFKKIIERVMECNVHIQELNPLKAALSSTSCVILTEY